MFVLPGAETNWADVGYQLQKLQIFNESISDSAIVLQKKGFNLYSVLQTVDAVTLQDPFVSVVASTVIQVRVRYTSKYPSNYKDFFFTILHLIISGCSFERACAFGNFT